MNDCKVARDEQRAECERRGFSDVGYPNSLDELMINRDSFDLVARKRTELLILLMKWLELLLFPIFASES